MHHFLNFCSAIEELTRLPKTLKRAVARTIIFAIIGSFVLSAMSAIQNVFQIEGFWKIEVVAWVIYLLVIGGGIWRICFKWNDGTYFIDEYDDY
jgi:hypothetical protein